jgi:DNA-binding NarL/FixJ family response regulator
MDAPAPTLRILLLEDDPRDAELIVEALQRGYPGCDVRWVTDQAEFNRASESSAPEVILADQQVADFNSVEALRLARIQRPGVPFIVISGFFETTTSESLRWGAANFIRKGDLSRLVPAIGLALRERAPLRKLSERQREVLQLLAAGISMRDIARQLQLSVKTVETHRAEVMRRLGIRDLAGMVRYAVRVGVISASQ